ncbi:unnamed protein product [Schistosoma haematobium]|nr:unnamed protein product [Schistosoma haematobium]CAH8472265.1 unnamed protein product [Schistosoma haematobium]CAH8473800.1 unnamed protein product [Schistosoma haematobium]
MVPSNFGENVLGPTKPNHLDRCVRPPYIRGDAFQFLNASREFLEFDRTEYVVTTSLLIQVVSRQLRSLEC